MKRQIDGHSSKWKDGKIARYIDGMIDSEMIERLQDRQIARQM